MSDCADKTDAELDALAAERMGEPFYTRRPWSPTTDANDRDEWVEWLTDNGLKVNIYSVEAVRGGIRWRVEIGDDGRFCVDRDIGRAVVIAGLRATDE